ncbi:hypothetical protein [Nocardia jiangxiensis]|uniref:Uncharacterized protein n=1 Tax=Nocardia jiangxiensis TaxID=282685 RepID=A0ABW6SDC2_9NOCA|nr:hypothetical protein [Nocardia jiangxiensis]
MPHFTGESACAAEEYRRNPEFGALVVGVEFAEALALGGHRTVAARSIEAAR